MTSCINNKRNESVSPIVVEKDTIKESYSTWIKTDSINTVFFTREIDGFSIKAVIEPDTAYSPVVGHVEYHLTKNGITSVVKTTYNHFFQLCIKRYG